MEEEIISSEKYLTGCMIKDYPYVMNLCSTLGFSPDVFESRTSQIIWSVAEQLNAKGIAVDAASIIEAIEGDPNIKLDAVAASADIMKALQISTDTHTVVQHIEAVTKTYWRRQASTLMVNGIDRIAEGHDIGDILANTRHRLGEISSQSFVARKTDNDYYEEMMDNYKNIRTYGASGIKSRFDDIQSMTGGHTFGKVTVIAARPGMGKSTLAYNETLYAASVLKEPGLLFSIEMDRTETYEKMASDYIEMDNMDMRSGRASNATIKKFMDEGVKKIMQLPLYIEDDPEITIERICSLIREYVSSKGVKLVVIDYLQLISSTPGMKFGNRNLEVAHWSNQLRIVAKQTGVAMLLLSQLSRPNKNAIGADGRIPKPQLQDLRDSGAVEQDAYRIIFLSEDYDKTNGSWLHVDNMLIDIAKNRSGRTGDIQMVFNKPVNKFMSDQEYKSYIAAAHQP